MSERKKDAGEKKTRRYRMTKRKEQAKETRTRLYQSALDLINEKGFQNVSIKEITARADISSGSFYSYFDSKEDLIFYTFSESDEIYEKSYGRCRQMETSRQMEEFLYDAYSQFEKRGVGIMRAIVVNYFAFPDYDFFNEERMLIRCMRAIIEKQKAEAVIPVETDTGDVIRLLITALSGVEMMWCLDGGRTNLGAMARKTIRLIMRGIQTA